MALLRRAFLGASVSWAALLPLASYAASRPAPADWWYTLAFVAYGFGSVVCHQLPERSFYLWSVQMPVCARCTGIYAGGAVAAVAAAVRPRWIRLMPWTNPATARAMLALAAVPAAVTLVYEWATGDTPSNMIRAFSGAPLGAVVVFIVAAGLATASTGRNVN